MGGTLGSRYVKLVGAKRQSNIDPLAGIYHLSDAECDMSQIIIWMRQDVIRY